MKIISFFYTKASILSLDVVAGAVCCSALFARQLHVAVRWPQYFVLGSSVWLIYTLDHLLDAFRKPFLLSPRHRFHQRYRKILVLLWVSLLLPTAGLAFTQLPASVIWFGISLGAALLGYLSLTHVWSFPYFFKEGWVALLYTIGVWGSIAVQAHRIRLVDGLTGLIFGTVILQQAMMLAWYEAEEDVQQQMPSRLQQKNSDHLHVYLKLLSLANAIGALAGLLFWADTVMDRAVWLTLLGIAAILVVITCFPDFFRPRYAYRLLSDGILMLPLWVLILPQ